MDSKYVKRIKYATYYIAQDGNTILNCDEIFTKITGYTREDITNLKLKQDDLILPEDSEAYRELVNKLLDATNEAFLEHRIRTKDGQVIYVFCLGHQYANGWIIRMVDMTNSNSMSLQTAAIRKEKEEAVIAASKDDITGLLRRGAFEENVKEFLPTIESGAFLMLDIDAFKQVNDMYGHIIGDEVLEKLSELLVKTLRGKDLVCRMGGDEFAVFLRDMKTMNVAVMVAERILKAVENLRIENCNNLKIGVSIGIKVIEKGVKLDYEALYSGADAALYQAKRNGKGRYVLA